MRASLRRKKHRRKLRSAACTLDLTTLRPVNCAEDKVPGRQQDRHPERQIDM
jgi:hypothetical protein